MNARRLCTCSLLALALLAALPIAGNAQWRKQKVFPGTFFNEVFFIDANHGWLTQHLGIVVRTVDGGTTWQSANLPGSVGSFNRDICFVNTMDGFVSGDDGIWKTNDGGVTWTNITPPGQVTGNSSNWFIDANNGVYGFGPCNLDTVRFYRTTNGGATWDSVKYGHPVDVSVGGICYYAGAYYAGGGVGKFWKSTDAGISWVYGSTGSGGFHEDAVAAPGGVIHMPSVDGSVCGVSGSSKMVRSADGGANWSTILFPGVIMWGVTFYSAQEGWCCADNGHAYYTSNGGASWTEKSCGLSRLDRLDDICFTDPTHGWAVGDGIYKFVGDGYNTRPDTINFGDITVGQASADSSAIVTALGSQVTITNRVLTGLNPLDFQPGGPLAGLLNVPSCTDVGTLVRFRPTSEGVKIARLEFTISGFPETPVVYLMGRGVKPKIASAASLRFDTLICDVRILDTLWVRNTGSAPLTISNAVGNAPASISFQLLSPALPAVVQPGDSVRCVIQFSTTGYGPASGTMSFISNDPDSGKSPWVVQLNAYRRQVAAGIENDTLVVIPSALIGDKSTQCVLYRNLGDAQQIVQDVQPLTPDPVIAQTPTSAGMKVDRGVSQQICFSATAFDTLVHTRRFRVRTLPCSIDTFITVRYQAVTPVITSAQTLALISGACDSSATDTIMLHNYGHAPLIIDRPTWSGTDIASFEILAPTAWPDTVPVGGVLPVVVHGLFSGPGAVQRTAALTFPNNDRLPGKNKWTVALTAQHGTSELTVGRHRVDVGDLCVGDLVRVEKVPLGNVGTAPAVIRAVTPIDTSVDAVRLERAPSVVVPNGSDTILFSVKPLRSGPFAVTYLVLYDPCDRVDTILVTGNAINIALTATPPTLDYGSAQVGRATQRTLTVKNTGSAGVTVTAWNFIPPIPGATVTAPPLPLVLGVGASSPVTVQLVPPDTGAISLTLAGIAAGPCPDTLFTPLTVFGVKGAVLTNRLAVDLGTITSCDGAGLSDSVVLTNSGGAPINILDAHLVDGTSFKVLPALSLPQPIVPGGAFSIPLLLPADAYGNVVDTLVLGLDEPEQPVIRIPLHVRRERAALVASEAATGIQLSQLSFGTLTRCNDSAARLVRISNTGTVVDSIVLAVSGQEFALNGATTIALAAGADMTVSIEAVMKSAGKANGEFTITWMPCGLEQRIPLDAAFQPVSSTIADVQIGPVPLGSPVDKPAMLSNTGGADQVIDHVMLANASPTLSLVGSYDGLPLPAGGSIPVMVHFDASVAGNASAQVIALMRSPCSDTITGSVNAVASRERIDTIAFTGGAARGRWGTLVGVPIALDNRTGALIGTIDISVTTAPTLLDPRAVRFSNATATAGWHIDRLGFDPATGTLRLRLWGEGAYAPLPTNDSLIVIDYDVLRGDAISCKVAVETAAAPANTVVLVANGSFALEDYCDAYGRLLRTSGNVALDQNVPNPFNPETVIEFETAFRGPVLLTVYDGSGREVVRLVDEELPAGRRRVHFDARSLASGVYTYKLVTGLQVLSRRMVVTK